MLQESGQTDIVRIDLSQNINKRDPFSEYNFMVTEYKPAGQKGILRILAIKGNLFKTYLHNE